MLTRLAVVYSLAVLLHAQGNGTIHGTVTDPSGAAVPDAKVVALLEERGTTREIDTAAGGDYVFPSLAVGTYTITVEAQGFKSFRRSGVTLTTEQNVRVDVPAGGGERFGIGDRHRGSAAGGLAIVGYRNADRFAASDRSAA